MGHVDRAVPFAALLRLAHAAAAAGGRHRGTGGGLGVFRWDAQIPGRRQLPRRGGGYWSILDDLGLHRLTAQQSADLYELILNRHRSSSFVITNNHTVDEWLSFFDGPILGNSALDRLVNASYQIVIEGTSHRERRSPHRALLAVQVIAHNLARWTARFGPGEPVVTTKTLRRRFFSLGGRLTRSARRLTLHLPKRWPWENQFSGALARMRALPLPT